MDTSPNSSAVSSRGRRFSVNEVTYSDTNLSVMRKLPQIPRAEQCRSFSRSLWVLYIISPVISFRSASFIPIFLTSLHKLRYLVLAQDEPETAAVRIALAHLTKCGCEMLLYGKEHLVHVASSLVLISFFALTVYPIYNTLSMRLYPLFRRIYYKNCRFLRKFFSSDKNFLL